MPDPWQASIANLYTPAAPKVADWPADRRRRVRMLDRDPQLLGFYEAVDRVPQLDPMAARVLHALTSVEAAKLGKLAEVVQVSTNVVIRRLRQLERAGVVSVRGRTWRPT
ncbi:MAG: helix-turn-helix domain-containing protein [Burkholderiales bacterium]|nr:helix-turn-helix domain-containing protein [Burkholderiales bacterium]